MSTLKQLFFSQGKVSDCPVYDLHAHMGPFFGSFLSHNSTAAMVKAMDRAGVKMTVFCHHASLFSPDIGNSVNIVAVRKFPDRLRAYCAINPNYPDVVQKDIHSFEQYRDVYVGFKFLADYHFIPITDSRYRPAWELADQKGLMCDNYNYPLTTIKIPH